MKEAIARLALKISQGVLDLMGDQGIPRFEGLDVCLLENVCLSFIV